MKSTCVVQWRLHGIWRPSIAKIHSFTCNFNFATDVVASTKEEWDRFCETNSLSFRKMYNHNAVLGNCNRILVKFMLWFQSSFEKFSILRFPYCHISRTTSCISYLFSKVLPKPSWSHYGWTLFRSWKTNCYFMISLKFAKKSYMYVVWI